MLTIETILSPSLFPLRTSPKGNTTVAIDILRATTSICAAFSAGASEVVPLKNLDELDQYADKGYTLAAERGGKKIGSAQCGNSPTEYLSMDLSGKRLAYSTTNGTVTILLAASEGRTLIGSFSNITALASKLIEQHSNVVLLCSGWEKSASLEDTLFAGALADKLSNSGIFSPIDDASLMAIDLWHLAKEDLYGFCQRASHVHRLQNLGYDADIRFSLTLDTCHLVPAVSVNGGVTTLLTV